MTAHGGALILQELDVVVKWPAGAPGPGCLFALQDCNFEARGCSVSLAGKPTDGLVVVQTDAAAAKASPARIRINRCHMRGAGLVVLENKGAVLDALIEESLLVGGEQPLVMLADKQEAGATVRLVRSTLVSARTCIESESPGGQPGAPRIKVLAWDSLFARSSAGGDQGDLFHLAGGANLTHVSWQPVNCLYAGWKRLLFSADKVIGAGSLDTWRAVWDIREGDQELSEAWPAQLPADPEMLPAQTFTPYETPALFAASGGPGPLGCSLGRLPAAPEQWLQQVFDGSPLPEVPLPASEAVPPIPFQNDGLYHGEFLDLTKVDLGSTLHLRLQAAKPGPHVVLHLAGKGKRPTSPIKVKGVPNLTLVFLPTVPKDEPLTLIAHPQSSKNAEALIEVEDGNLHLLNARFLLDNKKTGTLPSRLLRMRGGDLILSRCYLQGALDKAPEAYEGLIRFEGATDSEPLPAVLLKDSVLLSGRSLLELRGNARLRVRNCVALATDDGFVFGPGALPSLFVQLENSTLAARKSLIAVTAPGIDAGKIIVQARRNYFVNPFSDEQPSCLLRLPGTALTEGVFRWQGQGNGFDQLRLFSTIAELATEPAKQSFADWQQLWGTPGERDAVLVEPAKNSKVFSVEPPAWTQLALPPQFRAEPAPFGADLVRLGLIKRKG